MADSNDPSSPSGFGDIDVSKINDVAAANVALKSTVEGITTAFKDSNMSGQDQIGVLEKVKKTVSSLIPEGLNLKQVFDNLSNSSGVSSLPITNLISGVGQQIGETVGKFAEFSGALTALGNGAVRDFFNPIKQSGLEAATSLLPKELAEMVKSARDSMQGLLDVQNTSRVGFTRWNNSFLETSTSIYRVNEAASEYPNTIRRMSAAYVVNGKALDDMMKSLQGMPIILKQNEAIFNDIVGAQNKMVEELSKLIVVSQAFGMTEAEATHRAKIGYTDFNQSVTETISSLATMSAASKETGIDRKIADDQIMSASKSLTIFGQKSDAAASVWTTFTNSLKDTIPIKQVGEIVSDVTAKIAGMSVQNRAFISMMSGMTQGRSAMGGALQLEIAMRTPEGMEKNLQAMTSTLSQFAGGKVITLEEAANNPQLEIQFQLQRDMLGKISGISDTQTQNRVLEVLQKVQAGGMSQVDGGKELSSLMAKGGNIQERQLNALDQIVNNTRALAGEIFKPETQIEQIGNAMLGRTYSMSDTTKGSARVRTAMKETPQRSSLLKDPSFQVSFGKMFHGVADGLEKVIRVDLIGAIKDLKNIWDIGSKGSVNKNIEKFIPLEPKALPTTIKASEVAPPIKASEVAPPVKASEVAPRLREEFKIPDQFIKMEQKGYNLPMSVPQETKMPSFSPQLQPTRPNLNFDLASFNIGEKMKESAKGVDTLMESTGKNKERNSNLKMNEVGDKLYVEIAIKSDSQEYRNIVKNTVVAAINNLKLDFSNHGRTGDGMA